MPSEECQRLVRVISEASASAFNWPTIWQAEGMIMMLFNCDAAHALGRLADRAALANLPLTDIAQIVVDSLATG
jgi:AmiR/NasT family two-component response regulator